MSTERRLIVLNMHLEGMIFLYYGTPTIMPSLRAKKNVNVYSENALNMPKNERKITKLLPVMLHVVRLWITRRLSSPLSLCPFC